MRLQLIMRNLTLHAGHPKTAGGDIPEAWIPVCNFTGWETAIHFGCTLYPHVHAQSSMHQFSALNSMAIFDETDIQYEKTTTERRRPAYTCTDRRNRLIVHAALQQTGGRNTDLVRLHIGRARSLHTY